MPELPAHYYNHGTPTVVIEVHGGLWELKHKSEGCILIVEDYDAADPEQPMTHVLSLEPEEVPDGE